MPSAVSDVAALDIAVGHFGHLEKLSSSEISYPFAREVARIAYDTVKNKQNPNSCEVTTSGLLVSASPYMSDSNFDEVGSLFPRLEIASD